MTIAMTLLFSTLQCILKGNCYFVYLDTLIVFSYTYSSEWY